MAALGIFGGTFNPPHVAHLLCASEARWQLELDRVLLVPTGIPPHKEIADEPGVEHRLEMCRLAALGHDDWLAVSDIESRRSGSSYTVDTLKQIHASQPGDELTFIVGGDVARSLPAWRDPETILELARVAVAERAGAGREQVRERLAGLRGAERVTYIDVPRVDVSSAELRRRLRAGQPITYLVADAVSDYIAQRRLYT